MTLHLRFDSANPAHTRMTLFVNGASAGQLCMRPDEADAFQLALERGCEPATLRVSGRSETPETLPDIEALYPTVHVGPPAGVIYPRAAVCYQRLYTKLGQRVVPMARPECYSKRLRTVYITGTTAEGNVDHFRQLQRWEDNRWIEEETRRELWSTGRIGCHAQLYCRLPLRSLLHLDLCPFGAIDDSWGKDVVAIARWSEWEDGRV